MLGKKLAEASLEDLKKENEALYNQVFETGAASVKSELQVVQTENATLKKQMKDHGIIRTQAAALNLSAEGEKLITDGKSVEEALSSLIQTSVSNPPKKTVEVSQLKQVLQDTKSEPVGQGSAGSEFASYEQARDHYMKEKGMKRGEAAKHVVANHPELSPTKNGGSRD